MTPPARGTAAPLLEPAYRYRFLVGLSIVSALGTLLLYLMLLAAFSRQISGDYAAAFHALRHFAGFLGPVIALSVLVYVLLVCAAVAVLSAYALRKVAGPIYRMERALEGCVAGDPVKPVFFRHGDQAQRVGASFNGFLGTLREDRKRWTGVLEHAERLCLQDQATCRAEMETALTELEALLSKYR